MSNAQDIRKALEELVALKDLKDRLHKLHEMGHGTDYDDYHRRKPLAWEAARAALSAQGRETPELELCPFCGIRAEEVCDSPPIDTCLRALNAIGK